MVNTWIIENLPVIIEHKPLEVAKEEGAIALFTEKYKEIVRTVKVIRGKEIVSYELCGGTLLSLYFSFVFESFSTILLAIISISFLFILLNKITNSSPPNL
jgi:hypothetical protein